MVQTLSIEDFLRQPGTIMDARSPAEFLQGHIQGHIRSAINLPLFSNIERAEVGTLYKKSGKQRAIERGLEIVGPKLAYFYQQARALPAPFNFLCWRGGMRSRSM